jgi:hypothetical protein
MKELVKTISVALMLLISFSCTDKLIEHEAVRRIVNETAFDVKVKVFSDEDSPYYIGEIEAYDSIDIKGYCFTGAETYCSLGWEAHAHHGRIYFGTEKVQKFETPYDVNEKYINANPKSGKYGYVESNENGVDIYTYRITQEDYENAEDCNGSCD